MSDQPTFSGNEITDFTRRVNVQGDGLAPEQQSTGIWEATTNLITNGGFESNTTGWNNVSIASLTRIFSQSKFGSASGEVVTSNATANEGCYHNFTATAEVYAVTGWVRGSGGGTVRIAVRDNVGANPQISNPVTLSSTWTRWWMYTTALTAATWRLYIETDVQQSITFQIDGVQAELQPIRTPYVETNGGVASRSACLVTGPSSALATSQSWWAVRLQAGWGDDFVPYGVNAVAVISWATAGDSPAAYMWLNRNTGAGSWSMAYANGGTNNITIATSLKTGDMLTLIGGWTTSAIALSVNGSIFSTSGRTDSLPAMDSVFRIGGLAYGVDGRAIDGNILWVAVGSGNLTNKEAATIAGFNNDPKIADFPGTPTWFWDSGPDGPQQVLLMGMLGTGRV